MILGGPAVSSTSAATHRRGRSGGAPGGTRTHTERFLRPLPLPLGYGGLRGGHPATASSAARPSTASSIGSVSLPVKVFCCEGGSCRARRARVRRARSRRSRRRGRSAAWVAARRTRSRGRCAARRPSRTSRGRRPRARGLHQGDLAQQPGRAGVALLDGRPVVRRGAAHRRHHPGADQPLAVPGVQRGRLRREPDPVQRREQPVAGAVAGEDPSGAVAAVRGRREPDDQHRRASVDPQPGIGRPQ